MLCLETTVAFTSSNATNYTQAPKYKYQQNQRNVNVTFLFIILNKNALFRNYDTYVYLLQMHIRNIDMHMFITIVRSR